MRFMSTNLFARLKNQTPFSGAELALLIVTAPTRYKTHTIVKRNGRGLRLISQPTAELKFVQKMLVQKELADLILAPAATAYVNGLSIVDHAKPHAKNRYLLKLDFQNFFPSLKSIALSHCIEKLNRYSTDEIDILVRLLCRLNKNSDCLELSIGAPSSPFISNWVMKEFDEQIQGFCNRNQIIYTRYADDLALSSSEPKILDVAKEFITETLAKLGYLGLKLNEEKTVNVSKKFKRELVGLVLANAGTVSIGRGKKRLLRAKVHAMVSGKLDKSESEKLQGQLAFCIGIDRPFVSSLCQRYGVENLAALFEKENIKN